MTSGSFQSPGEHRDAALRGYTNLHKDQGEASRRTKEQSKSTEPSEDRGRWGQREKGKPEAGGKCYSISRSWNGRPPSKSTKLLFSRGDLELMFLQPMGS